MNRYRTLQDELRQLGLENYQTTATAAQYTAIFDKILATVPQGAHVLDWGCGNGHLSYFLLSHGFSVEALGMEKFHLEATFMERFPGKFTYFQADESDPVTLPYADNHFEASFSMGVLEHVRETGGDELASLREHFRVLKPGGHFLCFHFPNKHSYIEKLARAFPKKHHHEFLYNAEDIRQLVADAGFSLAEVKRYGALPRNELKRLPKTLANSDVFVKLYEWADAGASALLSPVVQNYRFIARKP